MAAGVLGVEGADLGEIVLAVGALGTAAYGLVDVSKALWGGVSNAGFGHVLKALEPYAAALDLSSGGQWRSLLRAHWLNGRSKDEQKAIARALVRLGIATSTAPALARAARLDEAAFAKIAAKLADGRPLVEADLNVLGRFDAIFDCEMDAGFERADQQYKSAARGLAAVVAVSLAMIAMLLTTSGGLDQIALALVVGILAVPLAPIAKDLASALNAAVTAVKGRIG
jgi:hypothetical protein